MNGFYVYAWLRPCGTPFYIGKGKGGRDGLPKKNRLFASVVGKIERSGGSPTVVRLHQGLSEDEAFKLEREQIAKYGRRDNGTGILTNLTDGGEGPSGRILSAEHRAKIGAANSNKSLEERARISEANRRRVFSASTLAKMSAANKGKKMSDESRAKMAAASRGRTLSDAAKKKIGDASRGNKYSVGVVRSPETRAKMSAANKGRVATEEARAAMSASRTGKPHSEDVRARATKSRRLMPQRTGNQSGFKGVSKPSRRKNWKASIMVDGKSKYIGVFDTPEAAARAYDSAAIEAWGLGNCYLNFPTDHPTNQE